MSRSFTQNIKKKKFDSTQLFENSKKLKLISIKIFITT